MCPGKGGSAINEGRCGRDERVEVTWNHVGEEIVRSFLSRAFMAMMGHGGLNSNDTLTRSYSCLRRRAAVFSYQRTMMRLSFMHLTLVSDELEDA